MATLLHRLGLGAVRHKALVMVAWLVAVIALWFSPIRRMKSIEQRPADLAPENRPI